MSKIRYEGRTFSEAGRAVVQAADAICQQYAAEGYRLTLRQLYYRFIATDAFPDSRYFTGDRRDPGNTSGQGTKNCQANYKWLGSLIADARVAGLIDWSHIEDRGRESAGGDYGFDSPASALDAVANQYDITHWDGQPEHVEVWVEKDALVDVIARAAGPLNVGYTACKGSPSHSLVHDAAQRLRAYERNGRKTTILYLGDHDPTGIDIPRDIQERLSLFRSDCTVDRIALTLDQVRAYNPPPNYAKETDSRFAGYVELYGTDCWELDALEPQTLVELVDTSIRRHLVPELYDARLARGDRERAVLTAAAENWESVERYLRDELDAVD
jgi:hypothetical protein